MGAGMTRILRTTMSTVVLVGGLTAVSLATMMTGTASASPLTLFSSTTPGSYTTTVPAGVTSVTITAVGGSGGAAVNNGIPGGEGGIITSTATVAPGDQLSVTVGANGICGSGGNVATCLGTGGSGAGTGGNSETAGGAGGGYGGGGGGGSAVSDGATALVIAGGGGGSAQGIGGNADQNGSFEGGQAGTLSGPGAGACDISGLSCAPSGVGPNGGGGEFASAGGGGGYFGGGAAVNGGGSGGASYPAPATQWDTTATPSVTITYTEPAVTQTISFGPLANVTFGAAPFMVSATATSGLGVSFAAGPSSVCTSSGTTGSTITVIGPGSCTVVGSQAGNANYLAAAPVTQPFTVLQAPQTISFGPLANVTFGAAPFMVSATATSGLGVSFAAGPSSVCTSSGTTGSTITVIGPGSCTVVASQAGNANYLAAAPVSESFTVVSPCAVGLAPHTLTATYGTHAFTGLFCVNAKGVGTYTQGTVSGIGAITTVKGTTSIAALGKSLSLLGATNGTTSVFVELAPNLAIGKFTLS